MVDAVAPAAAFPATAVKEAGSKGTVRVVRDAVMIVKHYSAVWLEPVAWPLYNGRSKI
jgi:hypothetical protein